MIESIQKSNHIITNHIVNGQSDNTTFGLHGNGFFNGGLTTIRRKRTQKVPYNQIEGELAHCTVIDENNNRLISDETVLNGGIYQLFRFGEHVFLERVTNSITIQPDPITPQPAFTRPKSTRQSTRRPVTTSSVRTTTTRRKELKRFDYKIVLRSEKYGCNIFGWNCDGWKKQYIKLFPQKGGEAQDAKGNRWK